jgi:hypothetical protein
MVATALQCPAPCQDRAALPDAAQRLDAGEVYTQKKTVFSCDSQEPAIMDHNGLLQLK